MKMISLIIITSISLWIGTFFTFGLPLFTPIDSLYLRLIGLMIFLVGPLGFFLWGLRQEFISKAKKARLLGGYLLINGFAL